VEQTDVRSLFHTPKHPYTQALLRSIPKIGHKSGTRLEAIKGMVPTPHDLPPGCPFHPRCPAFMPGKCDTAQPQLRDMGSGHWVSCFLYEEAPVDDKAKHLRSV
jgi:peptide/nickel transport system ATP-binding protein